MKNSQNLPESAKTAWKALLERIVSKCERAVPHVAHFYGAVPASVTFFEGRPVKLTVNLLLPDEGDEQVTVFLDENGEIESIRSVKSDEAGFDNGVRRGPDRRSILSKIQLRQDFDAEGNPVSCASDVADAHAELYIHTQSFVWGTGHETANSFLNFSVGPDRLLPTGGKVEDLTHFMGNGRITITERVVEAVEWTVSDALPPKDDLPRGESVPEEIKEAASWKLPYFVDAYPEHVEVFMADRRITALAVRKSFDLAELEAKMFPAGESDRVIDTTATLVETAIDRQ